MMLLRLFIPLFFILALSLNGMKIPNNVCISAHNWLHYSQREIIKESLQGLPDFFTRKDIPNALWSKAIKLAKRSIPNGESLYGCDYNQRIWDMLPDAMEE